MEMGSEAGLESWAAEQSYQITVLSTTGLSVSSRAVNLEECFMSSQQKKVTKLAKQLFKAKSWLSNYRLLAASLAGWFTAQLS